MHILLDWTQSTFFTWGEIHDNNTGDQWFFDILYVTYRRNTDSFSASIFYGYLTLMLILLIKDTLGITGYYYNQVHI